MISSKKANLLVLLRIHHGQPKMNTEELFVLSALKEFVRVWGSGNQAFFNLECKGGKACIKFSTQLGSPGSPHFAPPQPQPSKHHEFHGVGKSRHRGPNQVLKNNARAAAHRAKAQEQQLSDAGAAVQDVDPSGVSAVPADQLVSPSAAPAEPPVTSSAPLPLIPQPTPLSSPAASAGCTVSPPPPAAVTAAHSTTNSKSLPLAASATALQPQYSEVHDEILGETQEVFATAEFENCPDEILSEDYFESLRKFILSEQHLQNNIQDIKTSFLTSRRTNGGLFLHSVAVKITVRTKNLWEQPRSYIHKHLDKSKNDWLRSNKTRITLVKIHD